MKPIENFKIYMAIIKNYSYEKLLFLRNTIIGFIMVDLFAVNWWLGFKKLSMFLFVMSMIYLGIVLYAMKDKTPPPAPPKPKEDKFTPLDIDAQKFLPKLDYNTPISF